jgi:hypothetical protein
MVQYVGVKLPIRDASGRHPLCNKNKRKREQFQLKFQDQVRALARAYLLTAAVKARGPSNPAGNVISAKNGARGQVLKMVRERGCYR